MKQKTLVDIHKEMLVASNAYTSMGISDNDSAEIDRLADKHKALIESQIQESGARKVIMKAGWEGLKKVQLSLLAAMEEQMKAKSGKTIFDWQTKVVKMLTE